MGKEFLIILLLLLLGIGYIIALLLEIEKKAELDLLARFLIVVFWPFLAIWYIIFGLIVIVIFHFIIKLW